MEEEKGEEERENKGQHQATRHFAANANKPPEKWTKWRVECVEWVGGETQETAGDGKEDDDGVGHSATFDT